jgi:hypothetical protein
VDDRLDNGPAIGVCRTKRLISNSWGIGNAGMERAPLPCTLGTEPLSPLLLVRLEELELELENSYFEGILDGIEVESSNRCFGRTILWKESIPSQELVTPSMSSRKLKVDVQLQGGWQ